MSYSKFTPQVQDSIPQPTININSGISEQQGIKVERKSIDLGTIERRLSVDSTRIVKPKKKYKPIKKTIPYIPVDDTIEHAKYNALTGKYEIKKDPTFHESFDYDLIKPIERNSVVIQNNQETKEVLTTEKLKETIDQIDIGTSSSDSKIGFSSTDWMLGIIIFILILFGWIKVAYNRYVQVVVQASYNYFAARKIQEEGNVLRKQVFNFMNALFYIVIALFTAQYISYYHSSTFNGQGIIIYLICLAFWIVLYTLKGLFLAILDFIFIGKGAFLSYYTTVFIYNKLLSFILIPVISVLPFVPSNITPILFKLGFVAILAMYIMRLFRAIQTGIKNRLSIFYLILYLCALEILPLFVIIKLVVAYI